MEFDEQDYYSTSITEDWICNICKESLCDYWEFDDTCWYDDDECTDLFNPYGIVSSINAAPSSFTSAHCVCCDSIPCTVDVECGVNPVTGEWDNEDPTHWGVKGWQLQAYFQEHQLTGSLMYELTDVGSDCRACEFFTGFRCIPLRNWVRYFAESGTSPGLLTPCKYFSADEEYCEANSITLDEIQKSMNMERLKL